MIMNKTAKYFCVAVVVALVSFASVFSVLTLLENDTNNSANAPTKTTQTPRTRDNTGELQDVMADDSSPDYTIKPKPSDGTDNPKSQEDNGDLDGDLQIKQEGGKTMYSVDGGKTWSENLPNNSGISGLNVEEMPE
jgi:hypothetical protein